MAFKKKTIFKPAKHAKASGPHKQVLKILQSAYSGYSILEEQSIDADVKGRVVRLPVDLVIKELMVAIEVQGEQHYAFNSHFHRAMEDFRLQQVRDRAKASAIVGCGWTYLAIPSKEIASITPTTLIKRITTAMRKSTKQQNK